MNVEFFAWAFLNKERYGPNDEEELEEYLDKTELALGRQLERGRGHATPLRVTIDEVKTSYRSSIWYFVSATPSILSQLH